MKLDQPVAILDANILFPYRKRDILLRCFEAELFQARWSKRILDEWTRNVIKQMPQIRDSILSQQRAMMKLFPDAVISGHEPLAVALDLPDPDDRHVLAAAIHCCAQYIVTDNTKDFPANIMRKHEIEALNADEFLTKLFDLDRDATMSILEKMRKDYSKPAYSHSEFLDDLVVKGLPILAARVQEHGSGHWKIFT